MIRERLVKVIQNLAPTPIAWIAIVVGVFVHLAGFFLFNVEVPCLKIATSPDPYISYVSLEEKSGNQDLRERALLSDSVPLFLPGEYDYSWDQLQPNAYMVDSNAPMTAPVRYQFSVHSSKIIEDPLAHYKKPLLTDMLSADVWDVYETLGMTSDRAIELDERFGVFLFKKEADGRIVKEVEVVEAAISDQVDNILWKPCEVVVWVGQEGSLGEPIVSVSSGVIALDRWVTRWIKVYCNQRQIMPGYYRVVFGS